MKILISEEQYKLLFENYSEQIMTLRDLAEMTSRQGHYDDLDIRTFHMLYIEAYKRHGDDGVITLFEGATGLRIEPISRAKYIFKYN